MTLVEGSVGWAAFCRTHGVSRETQERLRDYQVILARWQERINLVGPATLGTFWDRHVLDCAQIWALAPDCRAWLDVGSGAGLPGLIIASLGANTQTHVTMVESSTKRCAFLREAARVLGVADAVTILPAKIEDVDFAKLVPPPQVMTARAFTALSRLLEIGAPLVRQGTTLLLPKGHDVGREIEEASIRWHFTARRHPSLTDPAATVLEINDLQVRSAPFQHPTAPHDGVRP